MGQFSLSLAQFVEKTGQDADQVIRKACLSLLNGVVYRSPVDTGRFRGNWQTTIGTPATAPISVEDKNGGATVTRGLRALAGVKGGAVVWITNNLPYAQRLENGWSDQAPYGMVRVTVTEFQTYINQAIRSTQ